MKSARWKRKILRIAFIGCIILVFNMVIGILPSTADVADVHYIPNLIPSHPGVISPVEPPATGWEDAKGYNQHRSNHEVMNWGDGAGKYDAYAVWTNEQYNVVWMPNANPPVPSKEGSHGFIEKANDPDYYFENTEASDWTTPTGQLAKQYIVKAFNAYSNITLDAASVAKGLVMGLSFSETQDVNKAEIRIRWGNMGPLDLSAWFPTPASGGYYVLAFNSAYPNFYFGDSRDAFLNSGKVEDFYTIALHEVGHVIGLTHSATGDELDIMNPLAGNVDLVKKIEESAFQNIGADTTEFARDGYSTSTPEPATVISFLLGALGFALKRFWK